jgi:hypothetical protein
VLISAATLWEIGIKTGLGKLSLSMPDLEATILPITIEYADAQRTLPKYHRDPSRYRGRVVPLAPTSLSVPFDRDRKIQARALRYFNELIEYNGWKHVFDSPTYGSKELFVPLQADVVAYETYRHMKAVHISGDEMRPEFRALITASPVVVKLADAEVLATVAPEFRARGFISKKAQKRTLRTETPK